MIVNLYFVLFVFFWYKQVLIYQLVFYPGPGYFLLFFIGKFCDASRFFYLFIFFIGSYEVLRAEKRKPLVKSLTFRSWAFDHHFWLEDIFNWSASHMIGWINLIFLCEKKMTSLTAVKCWASMKVRCFLFSRLGTSISTLRLKFPNKKKDNIKRKPLGPGY